MDEKMIFGIISANFDTTPLLLDLFWPFKNHGNTE